MRLGGRMAVLAMAAALAAAASAEARKVHTVALGAVRRVPYSKAGDPAGALAAESELKIRALLVDGVLKEWTTGDAHDVTDRSFVVRRAIKLNDALPSDKSVSSDKSNEKPARRPAAGSGSGVRGCWWTALPAISLPSSCPTTTPA